MMSHFSILWDSKAFLLLLFYIFNLTKYLLNQPWYIGLHLPSIHHWREGEIPPIPTIMIRNLIPITTLSHSLTLLGFQVHSDSIFFG